MPKPENAEPIHAFEPIEKATRMIGSIAFAYRFHDWRAVRILAMPSDEA